MERSSNLSNLSALLLLLEVEKNILYYLLVCNYWQPCCGTEEGSGG